MFRRLFLGGLSNDNARSVNSSVHAVMEVLVYEHSGRSNYLSLCTSGRSSAARLGQIPTEEVLLSHLFDCQRLLELRGKVHSQVEEQLPKYGEHDTLQTIGNDTRLEASAKQAEDTILQDDQPGSLGYTQLGQSRLTTPRVCHVSGTPTVPRGDLLYDTFVSFT